MDALGRIATTMIHDKRILTVWLEWTRYSGKYDVGLSIVNNDGSLQGSRVLCNTIRFAMSALERAAVEHGIRLADAAAECMPSAAEHSFWSINDPNEVDGINLIVERISSGGLKWTARLWPSPGYRGWVEAMRRDDAVEAVLAGWRGENMHQFIRERAALRGWQTRAQAVRTLRAQGIQPSIARRIAYGARPAIKPVFCPPCTRYIEVPRAE